ncbi:MAG TPA: hypothetical protein PK890_08285 [Terrimesophilobacter sp.]|nr:hypothetical protein [Terrimesophilobacter sp.]
MRRAHGLPALILGVLLAVGGTNPALAAGELEVSPDGTSWGTQLADPLFSDLALVPRGSASSQFTVRNASGDDAFLRIVLQDVTYSSAVLGDAMQLGVALGGVDGAPAGLSSANPCQVLFEGELAAGQARPVVTTVSLGDLSGTQGQGETASFSIGIQLSDESLGGLAPTDCGSPDTVIEITEFDSRVATIASLGVVPNTWQLFEEYFVLLLFAALGVGVAAQWFLTWWLRRRHDRDEEQRQYLEDLA